MMPKTAMNFKAIMLSSARKTQEYVFESDECSSIVVALELVVSDHTGLGDRTNKRGLSGSEQSPTTSMQ